MNGLIIAMLFNMSIFAQSSLWFITASAIAGTAGGITEGYRMEWTFNERTPAMNKLWHNWSFVSRVSIVCLGISIADYSNLELWELAKSLILSSSIYFFMHDLSYNITRKLPPFRVSDSTGAFTEAFASFPVKILFIVVAGVINIVW